MVLDLLHTLQFEKFISQIIKKFCKIKITQSLKRELSFQKIDIQGVNFRT